MMSDKEGLVNAKKMELGRLIESGSTDQDLLKIMQLTSEICTMLQDMYVEMRDRNIELEGEVEKWKLAVGEITAH